MERDSSNAISWVNSFLGPWKMQFYLNEIRLQASPFPVSFQHISRSANSMADCLAKQRVDHSCNLSASILSGCSVSNIVLLYWKPCIMEALLLYFAVLPLFKIIFSYR